MFTILKESQTSQARLGILHLPQGDVLTPCFMPVGTQGALKAVSHESLEKKSVNLILANTYHLYLRPGVDIISQAGGLHKFSSWQGNILTDSGGFQIFSLKGLRKIQEEGVKFQSHIDGSYHFLTPEKVVDLQASCHSDIQMVLDVCTSPKISYKEALEALKTTTEWAKKAEKRWQEKREDGYKGYLFSIVQGNFYKDLRKRSVDEVITLDTPGIAIGGLSVGETTQEFCDFLCYTAGLLPKNKPRYVMGIGTINYILEAVTQGIDMFDCVNPTRIARHGVAITSTGNINLKNKRFENDFSPLEEGCSCHACQRYSKAFIRHLIRSQEILGQSLLSEHNLIFLVNLMKKVRLSISEERFDIFKNQILEKFYGNQD